MRLILLQLVSLVQDSFWRNRRLVMRTNMECSIGARIRIRRSSHQITDAAVNHNVTVTILEQAHNYVVVSKPHAVVCHHSDWTGSRSRNEVPMLQRTREATGRRVNLIHRLDRGCTGCLLMTFADMGEESSIVTSQFSLSMQDSGSTKTYLAIVRGEGILNGRDFRREGWFEVDRPIKDERGVLNDATTWFRFIAGQDSARSTITTDRPRASIVLARPKTGRWHQVRRHLNGLSHPIIGDSIHGSSKENREWRLERGLLPERTCLHLSRIQIGPTPSCPDGIDVSCPLAPDMVRMLEHHLPIVFEEAKPILEQEGITLT